MGCLSWTREWTHGGDNSTHRRDAAPPTHKAAVTPASITGCSPPRPRGRHDQQHPISITRSATPDQQHSGRSPPPAGGAATRHATRSARFTAVAAACGGVFHQLPGAPLLYLGGSHDAALLPLRASLRLRRLAVAISVNFRAPPSSDWGVFPTLRFCLFALHCGCGGLRWRSPRTVSFPCFHLAWEASHLHGLSTFLAFAWPGGQHFITLVGCFLSLQAPTTSSSAATSAAAISTAVTAHGNSSRDGSSLGDSSALTRVAVAACSL